MKQLYLNESHRGHSGSNPDSEISQSSHNSYMQTYQTICCPQVYLNSTYTTKDLELRYQRTLQVFEMNRELVWGTVHSLRTMKRGFNFRIASLIPFFYLCAIYYPTNGNSITLDILYYCEDIV